MKELNVNELRALIRLIAPLRALREDVEKALHLEIYSGTGNLVIRSLEALRDEIYDITQENYVASLNVDLKTDASDKEKFAQVMMISGQMLAYLEAHTGTAGICGERRGNYSVQTAPNIHLNMGDVVGGEMDRIMGMVKDAMRGAPRPPKPPKPPTPPRGPKIKRDPFGFGAHGDEDYVADDEDDEV